MPPVQEPDATLLDLGQLADGLGVDLPAAFAQLAQLYADVDRQLAQRSAALQLPCGRGCSACCHQSVFVTPLEFLYVWAWAQAQLSRAQRQQVVALGLQLYRQHHERIQALQAAAAADEPERLRLAAGLRFRCPFLSVGGDCRVHPARELLARLFGASFLGPGGEIYGCQWVADHLAGRRLSLPQARAQARRLHDLPLTGSRQVYPYYFQLFFAQSPPPGP